MIFCIDSYGSFIYKIEFSMYKTKDGIPVSQLCGTIVSASGYNGFRVLVEPDNLLFSIYAHETDYVF